MGVDVMYMLSPSCVPSSPLFPLPDSQPPNPTFLPYRSTLLEGPEFVDVPALSSKDYKLAVHCFTTAPTAATVTFKNEASGEYSFYELKYTAGAPPSRGTLSLECPVRTQTSTKVRLGWENYLRRDLDDLCVLSSFCTHFP
jgi:hypothetical protein